MAVKNKYDYINLDYLELMADGDISMKKILLDMLLEELPTELQKMESFLQVQQWKELGDVSHKMKSTLAYVGNDAMTIANKTIETLCKSGEDLGDLPSLVVDLQNTFRKVLPELQAENAQL